MTASPKILVIRLSSLGDVILSTALFPNLKAKWPSSSVTVLTKNAYAGVFAGNPHVDALLRLDAVTQPFSVLAKRIREERFDVIIDLHGNIRSWFLRFFAGAPITIVVEKAAWARNKLVMFKRRSAALSKSVRERILECLKPLDVPRVKSDTELTPQAADKTLAKFDLPEKARLIGVAPGAKHNTKRWSAERFAEAANRLGAYPNSHVVLLGDPSDHAVAASVSRALQVPHSNLAGKTTLEELIAVASKLSFLLTNDSGLMHVGEALAVPLVALFGPTVRSFGFAPYRATSRVVEVVNLPCRPCTLHGDPVCPLRHHRCMEDIDVNAVLYAASSVLEPQSA